MKNYLLILVLLIAGCASKTHIAGGSTNSENFKFKNDSSVDRMLLVNDKTVKLITRTIDTNITVKGQQLSGYLPPIKSGHDTIARFENEDLTVLMSIDKLGFTHFTAKSKPQSIPIKAVEQVAIYNDVVTAEDAHVKSKTSLENSTKLVEKHSEKQTTPQLNFWLMAMPIVLLLAAFIWIFKKINVFKALG